MARPTDYTPELVKRAEQYLQGPFGNSAGLEVVPTVAGLALYIGVSRETIYAWVKDADKAEFSDIVGGLQALQEKWLLHGGLVGKFNPTITKLMLSKHGYRESQDITSDGKALPTPIMGGVTKDETNRDQN